MPIDPNRLCTCHGLPTYRDPSDGWWRCRVKMRQRRRLNQRNVWANKLARGEQIRSCAHHHQGMAVLKARLGDPRPEGLTLSLVHFDSPSTYWGRDHGKPYRLSTDPNDYVWETMAENNRRRRRRSGSRLAHYIALVKAGKLDLDEHGNVVYLD